MSGQVDSFDAAYTIRDFPDAPAKEVSRHHVLETLAEVTSRDTPVVFLEGGDGVGATTLLSQFCKSGIGVTFSLFIRPASKFAYSASYLMLVLAEQFKWYLDQERLDRDVVDSAEFELLLLKVRKKKRSGIIYFVVDGLHQIPAEDKRAVDQILKEVLPIGIEGFRFLITGVQEVLGRGLKGVKSKPYQVQKFSPQESQRLLEDLEIDDGQRKELEKICRGIPGYLASVRRLILGGVPVKAILESEPSGHLEFIKLEYRPVNELADDQKLMLAVLAFSRNSVSVEEILGICKASSQSDFDSVVTRCSFLKVDQGGGCIEFASETHRRFVAKSLDQYKGRAITLQIEYLRNNPNSSTALELLPSYFQAINQQQAIVDLLSPEHYSKLLEATQSISVLKARAALGARSAAELSLATELFQFALQKSMFSAVARLRGEPEEISALVALGQTQEALNLASQEVGVEGRLGLLAEYARRVKEQGRDVDPDLVSYIRELASKIEFSDFGDESFYLAENIVFIDPDLALSIVEKSSGGGGANDQAFARLSFVTALSDSSDKKELSDRARKKISSESLQRLMSSMNAIVEDFSFEEIIGFVSKIEFDRRIYFLRSLVSRGGGKEGALDVIDYCLDQMVENAAYRPKVVDFADLARGVPEAADSTRVRKIIKRMESQLGLVEDASTSRDLVKFHMALAAVESNYDREGARLRIAGAYYDTCDISSLEMKVECLAIIVSALEDFDKDCWFEQVDGFRSVATSDLQSCLNSLLEDTANHFNIVEGVLHTLGRFDLFAAFSVIERINLERGRDSGYRVIAGVIAELPASDHNVSCIYKAVNSIVDLVQRDVAIASIFSAIHRRSDGFAWVPVLDVLRGKIVDSYTAGESILNLVDVKVRQNVACDVSDLMEHFERVVVKIDSSFSRGRLFYLASASFAKVDREQAVDYYRRADELRRKSAISSEKIADIIFVCVNLLLRAIRPLLKVGGSGDYLPRFVRLVEKMPCALTRASIYGDLVSKAWCEGKQDLCREIYNKYCRPLLECSEDGDDSFKAALYSLLFAPAYCAHPGTAYEILGKMLVSDQAVALQTVGAMIIRKVGPREPWSGDDDRLVISHADMVDVLDLMERAPVDSCFYGLLCMLVKAALSRESKMKITSQQRADAGHRIKILADSKLPDAKNVRHDGYLVVSEAQVHRLNEAHLSVWKNTISAAYKISNVSDRIFVLIEVADCLPGKAAGERRKLFEDAYSLIPKIPSAWDRFNRLESYIRTVRKTDPLAAKAAIKEALLFTFEVGGEGVGASFRRRVVDLAELIEPGSSVNLEGMIDDDPARAAAKAELRESADVQKLKRQISSPTEKFDKSLLSDAQLPEAAWKNLGALISGRLGTKAPVYLNDYLLAAGDFDLFEAYPILAWYLENSARRFSGADVESKLAPLNEVILLSTELAISVISQSSSKNVEINFSSNSVGEGVVVGADGRSEAMDYIRNWLRVTGSNTVILCDPYFSPSDVDFFKMALSECDGCSIKILTSKKAISKYSSAGEDAFLEAWTNSMDQDPPDAEIIAVNYVGDDRSPIHDRWLIVGGRGLRLGTSFNSLGAGKVSEISVLSFDKVVEISEMLAPFLARQRIVNGGRVTYTAFSL